MPQDRELVFSTSSGSHKKKNRKKNEVSQPVTGAPTAILRIEKKGRGGKTVTVVETRGIETIEVKSLGKQLKNHVGSGGTTKGFIIEIQGDHRSRCADFLKENQVIVKG